MPMNKMRVLIVDDNHHMIMILRTILRGYGIVQIDEARDPADAFEIFRTAAIDLVFVDFAMNVLDGIDFVRLVRGAGDSPNPFVPIIMLTAHSDRNRVVEARDAGVTEFLRKPVSASDVAKKINQIVHHPRPFVRTPGYFGPDRRRHPHEKRPDDRRKDASRPQPA